VCDNEGGRNEGEDDMKRRKDNENGEKREMKMKALKKEDGEKRNISE